MMLLWFALGAQSLGLGMVAWELREVSAERRALLARMIESLLTAEPDVTR